MRKRRNKEMEPDKETRVKMGGQGMEIRVRERRQTLPKKKRLFKKQSIDQFVRDN